MRSHHIGATGDERTSLQSNWLCRSGEMDKNKNIIFIFSDQHNPKFTGYEGHEFVLTPNLDRLAQQGIRFSNAYTSNPLCVPARYSMLSGQYCRDLCVYSNQSVPSVNVPSFAGYLSQNGWETALIGKAHFVGGEQFCGYKERAYGDFLGIAHQTDPYRGANKYLEGPGGGGNHPVGGAFKLAGPSGIPEFQTAENIITHEAVKWLQIHRSVNRENPFLLSVHYPKPHFPYQPPARWFEKYREAAKGRTKVYGEAEMSDSLPIHYKHWKHFMGYEAKQEELDRTLAGYAGNVSYMDECIGHLLDSIEHLGYMEDTVIIYSSDHGEMAGKHGLWHKQIFYEDSVRVPMIISGPGIERGKVRNNLISLVDMFPTLCDLAGLDIPDHCAGKSIVPLLNAPEDWSERMVFSETAWHPGIAGCMVRQGPWKYCWYTDNTNELYNVEQDVNELHNLNTNPEYKDITNHLKKAVIEFFQPQNLEERLNALAKTHGKGNVHDVAMQYNLPDGSQVDAWP